MQSMQSRIILLICDSRLREETLKSLVYVIDKLEENQLQDKLVRCISNLQQDPENSIRTNATIFMSRIMPKLKDSVRSDCYISFFLPVQGEGTCRSIH